MPKITLDEESYWKLKELKIKFKAKTWKELVDKLAGLLEKMPVMREADGSD